jgi:elongation factor P
MKATEIRKGNIIKVGNDLFRVLAMQHITPGNWRGMVQTKLRNIKTGSSSEIRFRSEDEVEKIALDTKQMQYLYHDQSGYHFMDTDTYEQVALSDDVLGDTMSYVIPETMIEMEWHDSTPLGIELPTTVDLKVVECAPGIKGATASAQRKPAKLETGLVVQVPSFIEQGELIRVATEDGSYLERAK